MKSNWVKYVFIIFIVIILIFSIYKIKKDETQENESRDQIETSEQNKIKELRFGIAEFDTINPILSNNKNVQDITKIIYEPLVNLTSEYKAEPCLAKEWAKQDNSYLIKLRENVKWSDGQSFTSDDVVFTIDRLKDTSSLYSYNVQYVTSVDIIDDYTVRINLSQEVPFFEYNLTFPILSSSYYEGEDFATSEKNRAPVTTGKYKISEVEGSYISLEKNTMRSEERRVGKECRL